MAHFRRGRLDAENAEPQGIVERWQQMAARHEADHAIAHELRRRVEAERDALAVRLAEVERERDRIFEASECNHLAKVEQFHRAEAAEDRVAAVQSLIDEAEAGAGIVITPGFTTYYAVDTGLLRTALAVPAGTAQPDEEQP